MSNVKLTRAVAMIILCGFLLLNAKPAGPQRPAAPATDFQGSFMTWDLPPPPRASMRRHNIPLGNKARIQLDAWIEVTNEATGTTERFVLIAPCRTEWVYAENHLFQIPSSEYRFIFSLTRQRGVGRSLTYDGKPSLGRPVGDTFRSLRIDLRMFPRSRRLQTAQEINAASEKNLQMVGRTEFRNPERKERYVLEYPIKTLNFRPESASFQVDTGPLLVPDFQSSSSDAIDRLELAHVCYNRLDRAEFILRRPVTIAERSGGGSVQTLYYSDVQEHPARNEIYSEK